MASDAMTLEAGVTIGFYEIATRIGAGGMGEVYGARDTRLRREVALKVIRPSLADEPDAADRFLREAELLSSLNHPNIVTIYETGSIGDDRYIAMEMIHGRTGRDLVREGVSPDAAAAIGRQAAEALAAAHAARIVHRDIKPENLMVRSDGYVKILDFGLARRDRPVDGATGSLATAMTGAGVVMGTVAYLSPEQIGGEPASPAGDVFALGIVLYEMLTGRHPFQAPSPVAMVHAVLSELAEAPSVFNPDVPPQLDELVLDMLGKEPSSRPAADDVARRLATGRLDGRPANARVVAPVDDRRRDIVGRDAEMAALLEELDGACGGAGRMVVVSGESGIGKTTLVETFLAAIAESPTPVRVGRGRCSERLAGAEAWLPMLEVIDSLQHDPRLGSLSRLTRTLAPSWYVQIAPASREGSSGTRLVAEVSGGSPERLKREFGALVEEAARRGPLVIFVDDLHWADPSTTDLLAWLAQRLETVRALIVVTARPSALAHARHAFLAMKQELIARGRCRELCPDSLDRAAVARYLELRFPGHAFPKEFARVIHERTEGHPLFMADALRDLRRRALLREYAGHWSLVGSVADVQHELPVSVRSMVQRKIDALDPLDRQLLGAASVQGVDFDTATLAAALARPDDEIEQRCERLEREHALVRFTGEWEYPDRTLTLRYRFDHHVYHRAFHESLRITRRVALSKALAAVLVERLADRANEKAADLAMLFETARQGVRAAGFFNAAAVAASRLHAHAEARRLAERGLTALEREPVTDASAHTRAAAEVALRMSLGLAIKTSCGYAVPEVGRAYARARELCRTLEDPGHVVPTLIGLAAHYAGAGDIESSRDVGVEMLGLFERLGDPHLQMLGEWSLGAALFHLGELGEAHRHITRGLELYDPAFHGPRVWDTGIEPGIFCRCEAARIECLRGEPDCALSTVHVAVAAARALGHPQTLAFSLLFAAFVHHERREWAAMRDVLTELAALCDAKGIAQERLWAEPLAAAAQFGLGEQALGLARMEGGLEGIARTHSMLLRPFYLHAYAEMLLEARRFEDAARALHAAQGSAQLTRQHAYDAERHRLLGQLRAHSGDAPGARRELQQAIDIAGRQGAVWLQTRAAASLATLHASG
jgi:tetratricopeptide (TPR) repeat protein